MGRAIVRQPQVFLFDEPLSNLDAKLRGQTRLEIRKLHAELGVTSLFVTHDQVEAMTLAQRMIVMNGGVMEQFGTPEEVYRAPQSTFVASFIGSPPMNLIAGEARGTTFVTADIEVVLPAPAPREGNLILGIRPEHVRIDPSAPNPLEIEFIEVLGAERLVHGRLGGHDFVLRTDTLHSAPTSGSRVNVGWSSAHTHWFDAETRHRLGH